MSFETLPGKLTVGTGLKLTNSDSTVFTTSDSKTLQVRVPTGNWAAGMYNGIVYDQNAQISGYRPDIVNSYLQTVAHDSTMTGDGTTGNPLTVNEGGIAVPVETDEDTIEGNGMAGNAITLKKVYVDGTTIQGNGLVGLPLAVVPDSITVTTDNTSIEGDGTSLAPIKIKTVLTDGDTINGDGINTDIALLKVYTDTTLSGFGNSGSPIGTVAYGTPVKTDDVTLQGDGTTGDQLELKKVYVDDDTIQGNGVFASTIALKKVYVTTPLSGNGTSGSPITMNLSTDGLDMSQRQSFSSSTARTAVLNNNTISGWGSGKTPSGSSAWNAGTGTYTVQTGKAGWYMATLWAQFQTVSSTGRRSIAIEWNRGGIGTTEMLSIEETPSASNNPVLNISHEAYLAVGDTIRFLAQQSSGSAMNVDCYYSITYKGT